MESSAINLILPVRIYPDPAKSCYLDVVPLLPHIHRGADDDIRRKTLVVVGHLAVAFAIISSRYDNRTSDPLPKGIQTAYKVEVDVLAFVDSIMIIKVFRLEVLYVRPLWHIRSGNTSYHNSRPHPQYFYFICLHLAI